MRCAEKLISPPADLHSLAPSKESAWEGNLKKKKKKRAVKQQLHEFSSGARKLESYVQNTMQQGATGD